MDVIYLFFLVWFSLFSLGFPMLLRMDSYWDYYDFIKNGWFVVFLKKFSLVAIVCRGSVYLALGLFGRYSVTIFMRAVRKSSSSSFGVMLYSHNQLYKHICI